MDVSKCLMEVAEAMEIGCLAVKGKSIWGADLWQDIAAHLEKLPVEAIHIA